MIHCTFENNHPASLRHVTVGAIVVNDKQEVLLVKRLSSHNFGKYTVPGGFLDRDEDTQEGTLRELQEETGFTGEIVSLFMINDSPKRPKEDRQNVDFLYIVKIVGGEETLNKEVSEIVWFGKDNLPAEDDFAFDHRPILMRYFEYANEKFTLPIVGAL